ncbi:MAG: PAS domain S-box protein, partial [Anaerolineales bacterium]|nr:PAS domain S-box protein [Anaerolineales bacterium]
AYPRELFVGQPVHKVLAKDTAKRAYAAIKTAFETGEVQTVQYQVEPNEYSIIPRNYEARINKISENEVVVLVRDITEKATAETQLAKQNEALQALNLISQEIAAELDLNTILHKLCEGATNLLEATSAYFSDWNTTAGTSTVLAEYYSPHANPKELISDLGVTYDIVEDLGLSTDWIYSLHRGSAQTVDSTHLSPEDREHLAQYGAQAVLSIPVISEGRSLGLFEIYESRYKRVFTESEIDLMMGLVNQTAVAIDKANLFAQSQKELEDRIQAEKALREAQELSTEFQDKLNALLEINVQLSEITELAELYKQAIIMGRERLGFDRLGLLLYDDATMTMRGTFGTDNIGELRDERAFVQIISQDSSLWEQLHEKTRIKIWEDANLWDDGEMIGTGWNCTALLLQENNVLGFLSTDNLLKREPLKPYQGELMALYAGTLAQLLRRLQTQNILRESEERNRILVEQSPLAVIRWDLDFCVAEWNTAASNIFGYSRQEALGKHARLILSEDVWPIVDDIWQHLTSLTGGERSTNQNITATGETIICEWYNTTLLDEAGQALGVVSIVEDVTEQSEAVATVRYQATILNQIADAVISTDMNFNVRTWNHAAEKLYGFTAEEAIGRNMNEFVSTEYIGRDSQEVLQELMTKGVLSARTIQRTTNGRELIVDTTPVVLRDEQGQPTGLAAVNRDVTQQEQAEQERERLLEVLENATDFIGLADAEGNVLFLNHAGRELIGVGAETDLQGQTMFTVHPARHEERLREELIATAVDKGAWQGEFFLQHQDGHEIPVSMSLVAHYDSQQDVTGFSAVIRDITAEKAAQKARRRRQLFNEASLRLTKSNTLQERGLIPALQEITEEVAHTLSVGRASIWLYNPTTPAIELLDLYQLENKQHSDGIQLTQQDAPSYFKALQQERILVADNVHEHYSTQDLIESYLNPLGITSMMDVFARSGDDIRAVLCLEHLGEPRTWSTMEQDFTNSLADIISLRMEAEERRQLEAQIRTSLERRSRQVRLSTEISQEISAATELFELYQRVVELVHDQFGYYHTQLLQYNPALDAVALVVGYGEVGEQMLEMGHAIPMGSGIIGTAAATGKSVLISNVQQEPAWRAHPLLPQTRSELAVPIVFGNRVLGVLDIQDDEYDSLQAEDQILLEGLCGQIATAIESTRLRQDMAEQLKELNHLQRLMSRDAWQSYQATQEASQLGYLFDRANVKPLETNGHGRGQHITYLDDPETVVLKPIKIRGQTIGAIGIQDTAEQPLDDDEQELLDSITLQVAEALENARLLEQTQKRAVELETVAQVSAASSTILDVSQLLKSVVDLTKSSFGLYHAHIYLYEPESRDMALAAGAGEIGDIMVAEGWRIPLHTQRSLVARAARAQQGLVVADTHNEPDFLPNPLLPQTRAELIAPMIVGDRLLGVLDLQSDRVNYFTQDDLRIHTTLASQVAIALQNANLFQEQRETAEKLREVDQLKSEFLASMSHELRTPLNSIIGFAVEGIDGELNERMEEDVRLIRDGGQHLRALIGDILDMSKIEAGMMDLNYSIVEVNSLANEVMATTRGLLTDKPVEARLFVDPRLDMVEADRVRLVQVLLNLLSNAAKFTDEGEVLLSMEKQADNLFVSVKDSGIGIRPEDIPQVFEQFRQIGGMAMRKAGGTGLGMPITKKLVEMHGGEIWLESTFGSGTTFHFKIPLQKPDVATETGQGYYS